MQFLWAFLGACSGLFIGLTKEGIDLFSTLGSVQGWQQIYTGTAANRSKKIDNGSSAPPSLQGAISPGGAYFCPSACQVCSHVINMLNLA